MLDKSRCAATLILIGFSIFASSFAAAQTEVRSPDQLLGSATQASQKGSFSASLDLARQARSAASGDLGFDVRYISATVDMAAKADSRHQVSLLNEAIKAANALETSKYCDGKGDPQISWHYMVVMGKLGTAIEKKHPRIASQIFFAQGKIANNLKSNAAYPRQSVNLLGNHLIGAAKSWAIRKNEAKTIAGLKASFALGFNDFDSVLESEAFANMESKRVTALLKQGFANYKTKLQKWARQSVATFAPFDFRYEAASIHGGLIGHSDYRGKIVVLDLWATWCPPCLECIPHFVKLHKELGSKGNVEVVGVSMDDADAPMAAMPKVGKFVEDHDLNYEMAMGNRSMMNQLSPEQKLPSVLFIDASGKVRYIAEGPHNYWQLAALTNELIRLSKTKSTSFSNSDM